MKLTDIHSKIECELWFYPVGQDAPGKDSVGATCEIELVASDIYLFRSKGREFCLKPKSAREAQRLSAQLSRGLLCLSEVQNIARDGGVSLRLVFFKSPALYAEELSIDCRATPALIDQQQQFLLSISTSRDQKAPACSYCVMALASNFADTLEEDDEQSSSGSEEEEEGGPTALDRPQNFVLFGINGARLIVQSSGQGCATTRFCESPSGTIVLPSLLRVSRLVFSAGAVEDSPDAKVALRQLFRNSEGYLALWEKYNAAEDENLMARARAIGIMNVMRTEATPEGTRFFIDDIPDELSLQDELAIMEESPPEYLSNPSLSFAEYMALRERQQTSQEIRFRLRSILPDRLESDLNFAEAGNCRHLILSISGVNVQSRRRNKARDAILRGAAANPLLSDVIEGLSCNTPYLQRKTVPPLSEKVRAKIFKHDPTLRQVEAIDIALNTPDIALIQGPPGTGKTTVITAIIERLNELADHSSSQRGQILVSGYQHDAVENLINRLSVNSLPALKFGQRPNGDDSPLYTERKSIAKLIDDIESGTLVRCPLLQKQRQQTELDLLIEGYTLSPSAAQTKAILCAISAESGVPESIRAEARALLSAFEEEEEGLTSPTELLSCIRALRCTEASFCDDGPQRAHQLMQYLSENDISLPEEALHLIRQAETWYRQSPPPFLGKLKSLRTELLDRFIPRPKYGIQKVNHRILQLALHAQQSCPHSHGPDEQVNETISRFLSELRYNPETIQDALKAYNIVYGATVQQSDGKDIALAKGDKESQTYDTVIIDEAARCGPLDLMIPMAKARNRILLIGDHRQLPHIIDEAIVRRLEADSRGSDESLDDAPAAASSSDFNINELLEMSMFQYMFDRLRKMEISDGIKRIITLDAQYRTHPLLGEFVSEHFYRPYGEGYRSPLPAELFDHNLPGIAHKAAVWMDVPVSLGGETRSRAGSRARPAEARVIAEHLHRLISCREGANLSFGAISFYKAQVSEILRALEPHGYVRKAITGLGYEIKPEWQSRLRIGTVDAFQGMEFDVVFLSPVRCSRHVSSPSHSRSAKRCEVTGQAPQRITSVFGHLTSDNRMCVSMSRQKKCLIVAGDAALYRSPLAQAGVPALYDYLDICSHSSYGTVIRSSSSL